MTVAIITTASASRRAHLDRQVAWLQDVAPTSRHVIVQLDPEPFLPVTERTPHVPPGPNGLRLSAARNRGAEAALAAGATLLVFLDVDCLPHPRLVERYAAAASQHSALLCGPVTYLPEGVIPASPALADASLSPHPARPAPPGHAVVPAAPEDGRLFWSLSFACSSATWQRTEGFDERYEGYGAEDTDFAEAARRRGIGLAWVGGAHALHQYHPTSTPPWQHVHDIVRNATLFHARWGWWPMEGWLDAFARAGVIVPDGEGWRAA